ncbi:MAG: desulfoferrodoxin [archaeon]
MTIQYEVYKCAACGNIVEVLHEGVGELVCCGMPMTLFREKTKDDGKEKHVPVVEKTEKGIKVKVGSVPHPMEDEHFIEWIEVIVDGKHHKKFMKPGETPEAEFCVQGEEISVREYCTVHGLWKA